MIQGPGYALTFLYYFSITVVLVTIAGVQGLGYGWQDRELYQVAVPFALFVGSIGAYFNQSTTLTIAFQQKSAFQKQLQTALQDLGYANISAAETSDRTTGGIANGAIVYQRPGLSKFLSGQIFVQLDNKQVMISGRASLINRLEKRLNPDV
jgi:hypothetical protein